MKQSRHKQRPRVVVIGAGFAGLTAALRLARQDVDIDRDQRQVHTLSGRKVAYDWLVVAANWFWSYLTFGRGIRLITGDVQSSQHRKSEQVPHE